MKTLLVIFLCLYAVSAYPRSLRAAEQCTNEKCAIANNCRCCNTNNPIGEGETPQLVSLTFDESVVDNLYTELWEPLLFERTNPDGNPITATYFVPHEYTDYSRVSALWARGFEIGVNSVTKNSLAQYWSNATQDILQQEFEGQRTIISTFANIPIEDIIGARTPQLQMEGDVTINAYIASGITYDSSWTSRSNAPYFPYTLDFASPQECRIGTTCPTEAHAGFWILPIINLQGNATISGTPIECNSLNTCLMQGTADEISEWLLSQVERQRSNTRSPLTLMVPSTWFRLSENSYEGFEKFLDALAALNDVFLVSQKEVIDWVKSPVPLSSFKTETFERVEDCNARNCPLTNENNDLRYMMSCIECPEVYPWLGNPLGVSNPTEPPITTTQAPTTPPTPPPTTTTLPPELF